MSLSDNEPAITTSDNFDVELKFYAGKTYTSLTFSSYVEGTVDPSTTGWTDVTKYIGDSGSFQLTRNSSSIRSSGTLQGTGYSETWFGLGKAILCLRRILVNNVQVVPATGTWELWWLGEITTGGQRDNYSHGGQWHATIGGLDAFMQKASAPVMVASRVDLAKDGSASASSTLATPAVEAGSGEFVGTLVTVPPGNVIDGNLSTLWISSGAPHINTLPRPSGYFRKLFLSPLPGYDQTKLWWMELSGVPMYLETQDRVRVWFNKGSGDHIILCANRPAFEAYFGTDFDVDDIIDVRTLHQGHYSIGEACNPEPWDDPPGDGNCWDTCWTTDSAPFVVNPTAGWIQSDRYPFGEKGDGIAWNQTGASVTIPDGGGWNGPAINVSTMPAGYTIVHDADGGRNASDFSFQKNGFPGKDMYSEDQQEWLLVSLAPQTAALTAGVTAGATSVEIGSTLGLLDSGTAICEGTDVFTYTGRTANTLTGIPTSGANAIGTHSIGASIRQVVNGAMQTGWPVSQLELLRPNNPALEYPTEMRVYFVQTGIDTPRTPGTDDWELDYDGPPMNVTGYKTTGTTVRDYGMSLAAADGGFRWLQHVLIVFNQMTNNARARMNEVKVILGQSTFEGGSKSLSSLSAGALAASIFTKSGISTTLTDTTSPVWGPFIGEHATGVSPYPKVLDDLARITGCIVDWGSAGNPNWRLDPWWPNLAYDLSFLKIYSLDAASFRGDVSYSGNRPDTLGVRVTGKTSDGLSEYTREFPSGMTASTAKSEFTDLVVPNQKTVLMLAETLYYKTGLHYVVGPQQIQCVIKGPGEFLRPDRVLYLTTKLANGQIEVDANLNGTVVEKVSWLIEDVTWEWGRANGHRTWKATARCRRYWL